MVQCLNIGLAGTKSSFSRDATVSSFFDVEIVGSCAKACDVNSFKFRYWLFIRKWLKIRVYLLVNTEFALTVA